MTNSSNTIIQVENISKTFRIGQQDVQILTDISFTINEGDFVIIFGPSGCGKSTLLHTILGLEPPSTGRVSFLGMNIYDQTTEDDRNDFRKKHVGMVYQQANWIKALTVKENVAFPLLLLGKEEVEAYQKAVELLGQIGMSDWAEYVPTELSSGQQQRVALMRAMINDPSVVIADEPTGNLDYESGQMLMQYLHDINKNQGKTIVMVTHDLEYIKYAKTVVQMLDGKVVKTYNEKAKQELMGNLKTKRGVGIVNGQNGQDNQSSVSKESKVEPNSRSKPVRRDKKQRSNKQVNSSESLAQSKPQPAAKMSESMDSQSESALDNREQEVSGLGGKKEKRKLKIISKLFSRNK